MHAFCKALTIAALASVIAGLDSLGADAAKHGKIEVPLQFAGSMPAVEVMVNGRGPFLFAIDTGGQGSARVDSSLVEKLGLESSGQRGGTDSSARNPQMMQMVRLASIEVGGLRFADVEAGSRNYKSAPRLSAVDGILTLNLFADYLVTLDYPAKILRLTKGELPKPDGAEVIDYKSDAGVPMVPLRVGENTLQARIDSGNMIGGFVLPASFAERLSFVTEPTVVGRGRSISGEVEIKQGQAKETVRLGRYEFAQPEVTFPAPSDSVGNIGGKVLSEFAITFDQKNARMRLVKKGGSQ
jgi:hypothetical protein